MIMKTARNAVWDHEEVSGGNHEQKRYEVMQLELERMVEAWSGTAERGLTHAAVCI